MSSRTGSAALTLLAALWVDSVLFGAAGPGCDDGKLSLQRDLGAAYWECPGSIWPESSTRRLPSVDTAAHDPAPARQICMNESISYSHAIPSSGAYRPVGAESGEYLYCPPQRWLNNLHHGATVLLYHPCVPLHERLLLSVLARSCLPRHVVSSHPHLQEHMPIAVVSWGRTLELSAVAPSDICDWLEAAAPAAGRRLVDEGRGRGYNLLLTRSAERHRAEENSADVTESLRQCFERITSSPLKGGMETERRSSRKAPSFKQMKADGRRRFLRAAVEEIPRDTETNQTRRTPIGQNRTGPPQNDDSTPGAGSTGAPFQPKAQNANQSLTANGSPHVNPPAGLDALAGGVNGGQNKTARPEAPAVSPEEGGAASVRQRSGASRADLSAKAPPADRTGADEEAVGVQERALEKTRPHPGSDSATEPQRRHQNPQQRPLGTDEAAWAAAALGFLLVLLTLSVLHTRLYRHWRTAPSLYWRDPQLDYDSVADVIRRRLPVPTGHKRRKRSRRPECVLLPSSSSSDEHC
ncbi:tumor protein p53-inducible protein 13 [Pungitius pungitius]|uniref:tumor protein p53-inducible protein 13 n=1 Tax=Pungitius pungitius TaxID=134920 RepID=UPI002E10167C